jgi:hypothetical protein
VLPMPDWVEVALWVTAGFGIAYAATHTFWRARSWMRRYNAGPPPIRAIRRRIWSDPGPVEDLDLAAGPGGPDGAPAPPFTFVEEPPAGSSPCALVVDGRGRRWRVKWGNEVRSEPFSSRIAWAAGYFVETNYFVAEGRLDGCGGTPRAAGSVDETGRFADACFELDDPRIRKLFDEHGWAWDDNPFVGTRELAGLKIMFLLLSNWDSKDVRDVARGSNTAIFEHTASDGTAEARYLIIDWGGSMGGWGSVVARGKWNSDAFAAQTDQFVLGVENGIVKWGYTGQRTADIAENITVADVTWINRRLSRLSDAQIRAALQASGATSEEVDTFARALRSRLDRLASLAVS